MQTEKIIFSKERRFGDKVNVTFKFLQQNFKKLSKCILYIAGPLILIQTIAYTIMQNQLMELAIAGAEGFTSFAGKMVFFMLFFMLSVSMISLVIYEYINLYTDNTVEEFDVSDVFKLVKRDFFKVLLAAIGSYLIIIIATIFLIIPGIYVGIALSFIFFIIVKERISFSQAVSRCFYLINGKWWSTFGLIFIMGLIQSMILYAFTLPVTLLTSVIGIMALDAGGSTIFTTIWSSLYMMLSSFLYALPIIATCFQYFSLVEMKESKGLLERIDSLGTDATVKDEETY